MATGIMRANSKNNDGRKYEGRGPRPDNTAHKRAEAKERAEAWQKLSPVQQLKALDTRFGVGKGATKQRARLAAQIERAKNRPMQEPNAPAPAAQGQGERIKAKDRRAQERQERPNK